VHPSTLCQSCPGAQSPFRPRQQYPVTPQHSLFSPPPVTSSPHNVSEGMDAATESSSCLMPLADMLNHRPNTRVTWLCTPQGVDFVAPGGVPCGAEVHNNYGPRPNRVLLLNYGFAIESNPSDTYEVICRLPPGGQADPSASLGFRLPLGGQADPSANLGFMLPPGGQEDQSANLGFRLPPGGQEDQSARTRVARVV
jgi:hypothetical protein